ncbi:MAG TPA: DMT family transporter [Acidobacteriaceae bacterium]|nr:DMT family transporter [Acidobacteriaceae bacterium]
MNGQLNKSLVNPWLASAVSFALITFFFIGTFLMIPHPLPTSKDLASMPWWAVMGGLVGAAQVFAGLTLVNRVGAGPFIGLTVTAAFDYVSADRPLRMAAHGPSSSESLARSRRSVDGRRRYSDLQVLKLLQFCSTEQGSLVPANGGIT